MAATTTYHLSLDFQYESEEDVERFESALNNLAEKIVLLADSELGDFVGLRLAVDLYKTTDSVN